MSLFATSCSHQNYEVLRGIMKETTIPLHHQSQKDRESELSTWIIKEGRKWNNLEMNGLGALPGRSMHQGIQIEGASCEATILWQQTHPTAWNILSILGPYWITLLG
jgi:hypothetical protein